jgi:release factor glutamine methyltransferase
MSAITYREALQGASSLLTSKELNPKIAEWLLFHLLQIKRQDWFEYVHQVIPVDQLKLYQVWINRVLDGEPYQYIIGVEEFYSREFQVGPEVLIPRPETELLVENVLKFLKGIWIENGWKERSLPLGEKEHPKVVGLDVGTGSGAIAISLALEVAKESGAYPQLQMNAVDISEEALQVARQNAERHQADVTFYQGDLLSHFIEGKEKVDFIVSNPPYIPYSHKEGLARNVVDFEPHMALFAEEEGLFFYHEIIKQSILVLSSPGLLAFEIGQGQDEQVVELIKQYYPQATYYVKEDYQGIKRMVFVLN